MQVLSAAYAFGICKHAELAGLHEQRASLPACLSVCLSACHTDVQTQLLKMGTQTLPVSASALQPLSDLIQMCCQEAAVYTCAFACSWI